MSATTTVREPTEPVAREVHPPAIRWMHWINVPLLAVMVWSGLRIYWADDVYAFGIGTWEFFRFFPTWVYEGLDIPFALARGMAFHFNVGWLFAINGLAYVGYLAVSGQWRHVVPDRRDLTDSAKVLAHDLHLRSEAPPSGRYNAAQKVTYTLVIGMGVLVVASGVAILKPSQATWLTQLLGGYQFARLLHFTMAVGFVVFFVVHVVQVARAGLGNLLGMITGYVLEDRRRDLAGWRADDARTWKVGP